jgi:predicted  nucleic acid-binding Zn-ribbon protein
MLPDLEHLIRLQQLEDFVETARRTISEHPNKVIALDERLGEVRARVAAARQGAADNQTARRALDKELAGQQARLTKFKDQLMEVKTNREYQAMQKEIEVAQQEVRGIEDRILERMVEADDLAAAVRGAEAEQKAAQEEIEKQRRELDAEVKRLEGKLGHIEAERNAVTASIPPPVLATFRQVAGRRGQAVAEARDGHCTVCHVRLRPKVFNDVLRNDAIVQCESCQRILYYVGPSAGAAPGAG